MDTNGIPMLSMCQATISTGPFSIANCCKVPDSIFNIVAVMFIYPPVIKHSYSKWPSRNDMSFPIFHMDLSSSSPISLPLSVFVDVQLIHFEIETIDRNDSRPCLSLTRHLVT